MERVIRVTGRGQMKLHPDTTRLQMEISGVKKEYADAVEAAAKKTSDLKKSLEELGFNPKESKTISYSVNPKHENVRGRDGNYKNVLTGYEFSHVLKLDFPSDNKLLGKVLYTLANCSAKPEFQINYTVADPEAAKNELLQRAVKDAADKAMILAESAGLKLGEIQSIDYSWGEISFETRSLRSLPIMEPREFNMQAMDIEPDDINAEDTVTVIWAID